MIKPERAELLIDKLGRETAAKQASRAKNVMKIGNQQLLRRSTFFYVVVGVMLFVNMQQTYFIRVH